MFCGWLRSARPHHPRDEYTALRTPHTGSRHAFRCTAWSASGRGMESTVSGAGRARAPPSGSASLRPAPAARVAPHPRVGGRAPGPAPRPECSITRRAGEAARVASHEAHVFHGSGSNSTNSSVRRGGGGCPAPVPGWRQQHLMECLPEHRSPSYTPQRAYTPTPSAAWFRPAAVSLERTGSGRGTSRPRPGAVQA
jgi:hypothetical protein